MLHEFLTLKLRPGEPVGEQIRRWFRSEMARGRLSPGARLPTVRTLALTLGVDPNTVARAYREMGREGLLQAGARRGTFVRAVTASLPAPQRRARLLPLVDQLATEAWAVGASSSEVRGLVAAALRPRRPPTPGSRR